MFKFLRKYNKWILAVGGTLLMVVFLIPQAIEGLAQSAGTGRATRAVVVDPDGTERRITAQQWAEVEAEFDLVNRRSQFGSLIPAIGTLQGSAHWFLLSNEAQQAGLVGPVGASQVSPEQIGGDVRVASRTAAKLEGVYRMLGLYQSSGAVSDNRLRQYARTMLHQAHVEVIAIPASAQQSQYQPTEAELQEQLANFGDVQPGQGTMGFGYRLPDRVKLEWLAVPASSVREAIRNSDQLDNVALRAHWMRELRNADTTLPEMTDDPEIPQVVREHLLDKLAAEQLGAIMRFASDQFRASRRGLAHRDGYVILPEDWSERRLSLTAVAQEIQNRYGIESPEYHATGEQWLTFEDLDELEGIGSASTDRYGTRQRYLYELISGALEFGRTSMVQVQKGVAGPPLQGEDGSLYLFRIVDVDAARPPQSVDEVRDQLVQDLQRKAHFEQLAAQVSGIEEQARRDGLLATALEFDQTVQTAIVTLTDLNELNRQQQMGLPIRPQPAAIPGIGVNRDASEQLVNHALSLPADVSMDEVPVDDRILAIAVEDGLAVLVVQYKRNMPLTKDVFEISAETIKALMLNEELGSDRIREAFSLENLTKRHQFILHSPSGEQAEEEVDLDELLAG